MPIPATQFIWFNGKLVPWEKATVHVLSHALHYGSSVFEGVRAYETPRGVAIFRLRDHTRRLFDSAKIYRIHMPFNAEAVNDACRQVISANALKRGAYLRPVVFKGYGEIGVSPKHDPPTDVAVAAWEWGKYLASHEEEEAGVDVCISSWNRVAPNTLPALAKAGGNYLSSQLIAAEARRLGFAEGIGLATDGSLSEGSGENLFLVKDGVLLTPALAHSVLGGLTRDTVMRLARERGIEVKECALPRELLYVADEAFFTGTAVEITAIRSVDRLAVGNGKLGPVTETLQQAFYGLFNGKTEDKWGWLDYVDMSVKKVAASGWWPRPRRRLRCCISTCTWCTRSPRRRRSRCCASAHSRCAGRAARSPPWTTPRPRRPRRCSAVRRSRSTPPPARCSSSSATAQTSAWSCSPCGMRSAASCTS
jgi:branched-chain amino acid aminotransferase